MRWITNRSSRLTPPRTGATSPGPTRIGWPISTRAFRDPAIDAVWCIRGGYGVTRILDGVDFEALARRPRAVIGYSDITALLAAVTRRAGLVALSRAHRPRGDARLQPPPLRASARRGGARRCARAAAGAERRARAAAAPRRHDLRRRRGRGARGRQPLAPPVPHRNAVLPRSRRRAPRARGRQRGSLPHRPHARPSAHGRRTRHGWPAYSSGGSPGSSAT